MDGHVPRSKSGEELPMTALLSEVNVNEIVFGTSLTEWTLQTNHVLVKRCTLIFVSSRVHPS